METDKSNIEKLVAEKKIYSLLGLSVKAGRLASGEFMTEKSVKEKRASLVIVASDASQTTKKMFGDMCGYYGVPWYSFATKETLGAAIGKEFRASLAVNDEGLANAIKKHLDTLQIEN